MKTLFRLDTKLPGDCKRCYSPIHAFLSRKRTFRSKEKHQPISPENIQIEDLNEAHQTAKMYVLNYEELRENSYLSMIDDSVNENVYITPNENVENEYYLLSIDCEMV